MKKSKILIATLVISIVLSIISINTIVLATDVKEGARTQATDENTSNNDIEPISEDEHDHNDIEIHEGDLYVMYGEDDYKSQTYVMDKYVNGNVFIFGQDVKITGQISGSLFVFASKLTIDEQAYIACHTFACTQEMKMNGATTDMYAFAGDFDMSSTGAIMRDLKLASENANIYGQIGRDVDIAGTNINVYKDEKAKAFIGGNLNYSSGNEIANIDKITVNGTVNFTEEKEKETSTEETMSDYIYDGIENIIFSFIIYVSLIFLAPKFVEKSKEYVSTKGLIATAIGLGFTILLPIVAFILLCTGIGVSISLILLMIYFILLMINSAIVSIVANEYISTKVPAINSTWKKILMIIPVSLAIYLIRQIPFIGGWVTAIVLFAGVGIAILYQFDKRKKETVTE